MSANLSYADAVKLLGGGDKGIVSALDKLTGGLLLAATGGGASFVLSLFDVQGELARLNQELVSRLGDQVRGLGRFDRTQRLAAAHRVIVLTGFFEAVSGAGFPLARGSCGWASLSRSVSPLASRFPPSGLACSPAFSMTVTFRGKPCGQEAV